MEGKGGNPLFANWSEEDRVNCPFFFKIGACRNGDRCNRNHTRPTTGQTLLIPRLYPSIPEALVVANDDDWDDVQYDLAQAHCEAFFEEVWLEFANYGEVEDMVVLDNVSDHMLGNVYVKFYREQDAGAAATQLHNRFYGARLIQTEYSPVAAFSEARCRTYHETRCARGGLCNFMHTKHIPKAVRRRVLRKMYEEHPEYVGRKGQIPQPEKKEGDRSRSRERRKAERRGKRPSSEERRQLIADWCKEEKEALKASG
mmetsp:Transcript_54563/g.130168  ORF Transcript_54563/g.130168 Transcript_54563/m.130168 type:complete len:257 (-) Transcript_54563:80-850(-)